LCRNGCTPTAKAADTVANAALAVAAAAAATTAIKFCLHESE